LTLLEPNVLARQRAEQHLMAAVAAVGTLSMSAGRYR
jgi:hypothetical protein